jgi:AraC-like DNA-binding protein
MEDLGAHATSTDESTRVRSVASTALLVDFAITRGLPVEAMLRDSAIREDQLRDPNTEVTLAQEIAVMRNVVTGVDDEPGMGLMAGLLCHVTNFGPLGFAIISSANLYEATEVAMRYVDLSFAIARHRFEHHADEIWQVRDDREIPADLRRFALERDCAATVTLLQDMSLARAPFLRVEVTAEAHPVYEMFGTIFGAEEMIFGAERTIAVRRASVFETEVPQSNPTMAHFYRHQCEEITQRRRGRASISGRVRAMLLRRGGVTDQSHIAADLGIGERTLRRRLASEGVTFRELSAESMGLLAEELLIAGLTVAQVAERLDYSSVSAFTTAFRSWKGQSPGAFAREKRGRLTAHP